MPKLKEGDEVTVTFTGTVSRVHNPIDAPSGSISIRRDHSTTVSYFEASEIPHVSFVVKRRPFNPKSGEVYLLTPAGGKGSGTPWFVTKRAYYHEVELVSPAAVYSLSDFKAAYDNDSWDIVRATVEPE